MDTNQSPLAACKLTILLLCTKEGPPLVIASNHRPRHQYLSSSCKRLFLPKFVGHRHLHATSHQKISTTFHAPVHHLRRSILKAFRKVGRSFWALILLARTRQVGWKRKMRKGGSLRLCWGTGQRHGGERGGHDVRTLDCIHVDVASFVVDSLSIESRRWK